MNFSSKMSHTSDKRCKNCMCLHAVSGLPRDERRDALQSYKKQLIDALMQVEQILLEPSDKGGETYASIR